MPTWRFTVWIKAENRNDAIDRLSRVKDLADYDWNEESDD